MIILGIDPSVNNVGIAWYDTEAKRLATKLFHPTRKKETTMEEIGQQIRMAVLLFLCSRGNPDCMILEYPSWQESERGIIAAQQGYTLDLAFIVGYLCGCMGLSYERIHTPTPQQWKGNVPKAATLARFERRFGILQNAVSDHEADAAMMIAWFLDR